MSYSFSVNAPTKAEAVAKVGEEFDKVVALQSRHAADKDAAVAAAKAFVEVLRDPVEGEIVAVSMYGSLGWTGESTDMVFSSASVSVNASIVKA